MSDDLIALLRNPNVVLRPKRREEIADELARLSAEVERLTAALSDERAHAEEGEVNRASRRLIAGFMLDCNVIGHVAAAENLVRAIKGVTAHRARRQG